MDSALARSIHLGVVDGEEPVLSLLQALAAPSFENDRAGEEEDDEQDLDDQRGHVQVAHRRFLAADLHVDTRDSESGAHPERQDEAHDHAGRSRTSSECENAGQDECYADRAVVRHGTYLCFQLVSV